MKRFAVNVDIDSLSLYHAIHGLDVEAAGEAAWELGVPRFLDLFSRLGLKATFFVVASDLERKVPRAIAAQIVSGGHELASHTWSHRYDFSTLSRAELEQEIARAEAPLSELRGAPVRGFRSPGYNVSSDIIEILAERGYTYDSSLFPCPPYYMARGAVLSMMRLVGKKSASIAGDWKAPFKDPDPHKLEGGLWEFPIGVLPGIRWPLIGTSIALMGRFGLAAVLPVVAKMAFVNLEFHALDLLDSADPVDAALKAIRFDLKVGVAKKSALYGELMQHLAQTHDNRTLEYFATG